MQCDLVYCCVLNVCLPLECVDEKNIIALFERIALLVVWRVARCSFLGGHERRTIWVPISNAPVSWRRADFNGLQRPVPNFTLYWISEPCNQFYIWNLPVSSVKHQCGLTVSENCTYRTYTYVSSFSRWPSSPLPLPVNEASAQFSIRYCNMSRWNAGSAGFMRHDKR